MRALSDRENWARLRCRFAHQMTLWMRCWWLSSANASAVAQRRASPRAASAATRAHDGGVKTSGQNIVELAQATPDLSTLVTALTAGWSRYQSQVATL